MPLIRRTGSTLGRVIGTTVKGGRLVSRGVRRGVGTARSKGARGETGMMRLFDLHAASCAGDTLITIGLAATIFFDVPLGEARSKVALYLLVTMIPFALLAPVVGPLLDHFRHGRRWALAATFLGRAFLVWAVSDNTDSLALYPAAFGVLALSRAYGVARSAAVPRLLPEGLGLSQAGARASIYGTVAGAIAAPIGVAAFAIGPQWPLRIAAVIFLVGMVISLRLPGRADSDPPEQVPRPIAAIFGALRRNGDRPLSGRLVIATLIGSATLRAFYGFLLLFLAFAVKGGYLHTSLFGRDVSDGFALSVMGAALGAGTFLATALGTRLRIHRPVALQSSGLIITAGLAVLTTIGFSLAMVALLCLVTAVMSGIAKLSNDATIQERVPERLRASAFAHSETILMLAFVAGGGLGLIPVTGRVGVGILAALAALAALRSVVVAGRLRKERLHGRFDVGDTTVEEKLPDPEPRTRAYTDTKVDTRPHTEAPTAEVPRARWWRRSRAEEAAPEPAESGSTTVVAPPGYHVYRPSNPVDGPGEDPWRDTAGPPA
ncbi:MFS transporter [Asanoa iriomotensis]|uniref:MFS transporter n=1 Tax=Asanoa iriomotensis TaxID=234613 RepID=A0ABQ4CDC8_9ACTN|nr:MFS transporter [Asanoa iriomotensis]GIF60777.1 MFS transporter [Asanoa iriomotensis]